MKIVKIPSRRDRVYKMLMRYAYYETNIWRDHSTQEEVSRDTNTTLHLPQEQLAHLSARWMELVSRPQFCPSRRDTGNVRPVKIFGYRFPDHVCTQKLLSSFEQHKVGNELIIAKQLNELKEHEAV